MNVYAHPYFDAYEVLIKGRDPSFPDKEHGGFFDRIAAAAQKFWIPASLPVPDFTGLAHGKVRPGPFTSDQMKRIMNSFYMTEHDAKKNFQEPWAEIWGFMSGLRVPRVNPEYNVRQYVYGLHQWRADVKREYTKILEGVAKGTHTAAEAEKAEKKYSETIDKINKDLDECDILLKGPERLRKPGSIGPLLKLEDEASAARPK